MAKSVPATKLAEMSGTFGHVLGDLLKQNMHSIPSCRVHDPFIQNQDQILKQKQHHSHYLDQIHVDSWDNHQFPEFECFLFELFRNSSITAHTVKTAFLFYPALPLVGVARRVYGVINLYDMRPRTWRGAAVCGQRRCSGLVDNMGATRGG